MKTAKKLVTLTIVAFVSGLSTGQFATADVSKEALKLISTSDKVETSLDELEFFDK